METRKPLPGCPGALLPHRTAPRAESEAGRGEEWGGVAFSLLSHLPCRPRPFSPGGGKQAGLSPLWRKRVFPSSGGLVEEGGQLAAPHRAHLLYFAVWCVKLCVGAERRCHGNNAALPYAGTRWSEPCAPGYRCTRFLMNSRVRLSQP